MADMSRRLRSKMRFKRTAIAELTGLFVVIALLGLPASAEELREKELQEEELQEKAAEPKASAKPIANTKTGMYQGIATAGVNAFLGIPYAEAPVAEKRWKAPTAIAPHEGIMPTTTLGPACLQNSAKGPTSEDCLSLNIWAPAERSKKRPVMVWIHGGGFRGGSNDVAGHVLADAAQHKNPAVVVAINYRLGPLGFFSHKSIKGKHANFGLLDMVAALEWVQTNIEGFDGDPDNVTIFGVSAGGMAVNMLMTSPLSKGLFHKAIAQSGYGTWPLSHTRHAKRQPALALDGAVLPTAEAICKSLIKQLSRQKQTREMLYGLAGQTLVDAPEGFYLPYVDGQSLKAEPGIRFFQNKQHKVPFITGGNSNEGSVMNRSGVELDTFSEGFGRDKKALRKLYRRDFNRDDLSGWRRIFGDNRYLLAAKVQADSMARSDAPTWLYYIDFVPDAFKGKWVGTPHGMDAYLLFDGHTSKDPAVQKFTDTLRSYWLNFAETSDPNSDQDQTNDGPDLPRWPATTPNKNQWLYLSSEPQVQPNVLGEKLDLLVSRYVQRIAPALNRRGFGERLR